MTEAALRADGISFSYGEIRAVDDVSFEVAPGEILGFLGPNGAGKSTTIKMLTGQLVPDQGSISVLGLPMKGHTAQIQGRIGVCFEEKNLYLNMSARENLGFFARLFGVRDPDVDGLLRRVGLPDRSDDRVSDFSKGMRQRLMMARALINRPDVLFLDEPTAGLDPVSARAIREVITEEAARGVAVFLTTHDMMEADTLSDRVAFINEGRILVIEEPETLKLAHGKRSVRVRANRDGAVEEIVIPLDEPGSAERIQRAVAGNQIVTIHTEEATLEDIFVEFAGRRLE